MADKMNKDNTIVKDVRDDLESEFIDSKHKMSAEEEVFAKEIKRKEIYLKERDNFFRDKPGYVEIINEIGEKEWIEKDKLKLRDGYFNFEDDMENVESLKKKLRVKYFFLSLFLTTIITLGVIIFIETKSYIIVNTNVKGAEIFIDGQPTGMLSDNIIEDMEIGTHVIIVKLKGYISQPDSAVIDIKTVEKEGVKVNFKLVPITAFNKKK